MASVVLTGQAACRSFFIFGIETMRKIISEAGKKAIETFVRENLSGRVNEETVRAYVEMAKSQMDIHKTLPSLEISMCFSLTGESEYLELEADDVGYEDCLMETAEEVADVFGSGIADLLARADQIKRVTASGERWEATVKVPFDGYLFSVTAVKSSPGGKADCYEVTCLGSETSAA